MSRAPATCAEQRIPIKRTTLTLGLLLAQGSPLFAAQAQPTDAAAPVPPAGYRSAFEGYRASVDEPVADWRALNEEVARVGGHAGIMRGAGTNHPHPVPPPDGEGTHHRESKR